MNSSCCFSTLDFETEFNRFANSATNLIKRLGLRVASRKLWDRSHKIALLVAFYNAIELAWQLNSCSPF